MSTKAIGKLFLCLLTGLLIIGLSGERAGAAIIEDRSVVVGSGTVSAVTTEDIRFTLPSSANVGSLVLEYCSNLPWIGYICTAPTGLDLSGATIDSQIGNTGFSIDSAHSTANRLVLTRVAAPVMNIPNEFVLGNTVNPSTPGSTVYIRISSQASTDGTGPTIDTGAVAFAVQGIFNVNAFVPPFLKLCVGITVAPDCSTMVGDSIDLGELSSTVANKGQSQYATATNDPSGYVVYALGTTMTSGNNTIPALTNPSASFPGTGQFGINLRGNLIPTIGQDPVGVGTGAPTANYDIPNRFVFNNGDSITSANLPSDYNRMTVSYLVNIPKNQPAGIYSTTITYVATVQF
jgi:hypothetical protein